jgi:hypothetical protein
MNFELQLPNAEQSPEAVFTVGAGRHVPESDADLSFAVSSGRFLGEKDPLVSLSG